MHVTELSFDQRTELKQSYICELYESGKLDESVYGSAPSYLMLADADELVPDSVLDEYYDGISFVNDDFCCTAGKE